jgi:hypothetical protein
MATKRNPQQNLTRLSKYGEVYRQRVGAHTVVVRAVWQSRKGDSYHVRVLRGAGRVSDEPKPGNVLWRDDYYIGSGSAKKALSRAIAAGKKQATKRSDKKNPFFGGPSETEVFEEEGIAGYRIEEVRSCKPSKFRVSWEDDEGDAQEKTFKNKGKALIWVGKQVKRRPAGATRREPRRPRRPADNPSRLRKLSKLTRV